MHVQHLISHVQGPVEYHAQIPERIFVKKGGTANIKNRNIFTRQLKCTTSDSEMLTLRCLFLAFMLGHL